MLRVNESEYNLLIQEGFRLGEYRFVDSMIIKWLESFPNDINSRLHKAKLHAFQNDTNEGLKLVEQTLRIDPENLDALLLYADIKKEEDKAIQSFIYALSGQTDSISKIYPWAITLRAAINETRKTNHAKADVLIRSIITNESQNALVSIFHTRNLILGGNHTLSSQLIQIYHKRFPDCLSFKLWAADSQIQNGNEQEGLQFLHQCLREDPGGVVIKRIFGNNHPYSSIWPKHRHIDLDLQVPASLGVSLNWNLLESGKNQKEKGLKEKKGLDSTKNPQKPKRISTKKSSQFKKAYVILSTNSGLRKKYGPSSSNEIQKKLEKLKNTFDKHNNWQAIVFFPDDPTCASRFDLKPVEKIDPWNVKLSIMDLEKALRKSNKCIGAILIVGNHEIIPFHRLPNPTDDSDEEVLSDNPYATSSSNYLAPDWPIGRIPGEAGRDPGLLIEQIRDITNYHAKLVSAKKGFVSKIQKVIKKLNIFRRISELLRKPKDFGYSAAVWRRSSLASFRPIGKGSDLRISPPFEAETIDVPNLLRAKCAYFNLHGLPDTPEWYGQRDFSDRSGGPDFPVAINNKIINQLKNNIDLVFTESCYGGLVKGKTIENSMALKFVSIKSQGFIGSTCIAYGSVFTPLIGADLLGFIFWKYIKDGYSFGYALMQAKLGLIRVMHQRQGYLDGEDQKTLLSFVLYGDPLGYLEQNIYLDGSKDQAIRETQLNTLSDHDGMIQKENIIPEKTANDIKEILDSYIPGFETAEMKVRKQKIEFKKMLQIQDVKAYQHQNGSKSQNLYQIMYHKSILSGNIDHSQYARVTMDQSGKILKLAVSR